MSGKVYIKTHGYQMNEYDSAKMLDLFAAGCQLSVTDNEHEWVGTESFSTSFDKWVT